MRFPPEKIRNVAIIAHIDHGKTTLVDALLHSADLFRENEEVPERMMDSYSLERERGITIFAKHTGMVYQDYKINFIDTPGHADFAGEVERTLGMVSSVVLLVDAVEGPMPQTRFVLSEALKLGLHPLVVINKIDRPHADPDRVLNEVFDLFVELDANDEQLDFTHAYASGIQGFAKRELDDPEEGMTPLFDLIIEKVPAPCAALDQPFLMQVSSVTYDDFSGRGAIGKVLRGALEPGQSFAVVGATGAHKNHRATKVEGFIGIEQLPIEEASCGDIVRISGAPDVQIGDTLCSPEHIEQLPPITLSEPTLSIQIMVNDGPFVGQDGKHVTMNKLRSRLEYEKKANLTLRIELEDKDSIRVCGRGELHLAILLEAMRREGYEFLISRPEVILKEIDGVKSEPIERVHIEVAEEQSGAVIEELSKRKGEMQSLTTNEHGVVTLLFLIPSRGLIGYRGRFMTVTKGEGILTSIFDHYAPWRGTIEGRSSGSLIATAQGKATGYSAFQLQQRGALFVAPGDAIYEGMIVGEHSRDNDLVVNITREKQLTNVRASGSDENIILTPPRVLTLEEAIEFIEEDERVEVTPHHIRIRKTLLTENERKRQKRQA